MMSSTSHASTTVVLTVRFESDALVAELSDGRTISVPLAWYPRLLHGSVEERSLWRLVGQGRGIHWPELDEDILTQDLLDGNPSGESQKTLREWLESRAQISYP